jgi:hypothetical protein
MAVSNRSLLVTALSTAVLVPHLSLAKSPPQTLLQRIRALVGLNKVIPVAAGGSRSGEAPVVCLVSPQPQQQPDGQSVALAFLPRPSIVAAGPLNELRLERNGRLLWRELASSTQAIAGPVAWPIDPLQPGEMVTLKLRARGASAGDFSVVQLQAVSAQGQQQALAMQRQSDQQLLGLLDGSSEVQPAMAAEILFGSEQPRSEALRRIRGGLLAGACRSTS